jgi:hypothetical protein
VGAANYPSDGVGSSAVESAASEMRLSLIMMQIPAYKESTTETRRRLRTFMFSPFSQMVPLKLRDDDTMTVNGCCLLIENFKRDYGGDRSTYSYILKDWTDRIMDLA